MKVIEFQEVQNRTSQVHDTSIDKKLSRIQFSLEDLNRRLSFIEYNKLNVPDLQEVFAGYTPFQMEERAVPLVTLFSRSSILLGVFLCELKELMDAYVGSGRSGMVEAQIVKINSLVSYITDLREKHINTYGRNVCAAFNRRLLSPAGQNNTELDALELLLIRFFGSANPDGGRILNLCRLKELICSVGAQTGCLLEAMKLTGAIDKLAAQPAENPSVPADAGAWSEKIRTLILTLQIKMAHLQKDLDETIRELNLNGAGQKELFQDISLEKVRELVSYLYQKFIQTDYLLRCYEAELRFALMEYDQTQFSGAVQNSVKTVRRSIALLQQTYIQKYPVRIAAALKRRLGVYEVTGDAARQLDQSLVYAFDMGIMQLNDTQCPGLQELQELLVSLGKLLGLEKDAEAVLNGIRALEI